MTHELGSNQSSEEKAIWEVVQSRRFFLGREVGAGELLAKEKKELFLD